MQRDQFIELFFLGRTIVVWLGIFFDCLSSDGENKIG